MRIDQILRQESQVTSLDFLFQRLCGQADLFLLLFKVFQANLTKLTKEIILRRGDKHVIDPVLLRSYSVVVRQKNDRLKFPDKGFAYHQVGVFQP